MKDSNYVMNDSEQEIRRLTVQNEYIKNLYDHPPQKMLPDVVDIVKPLRVLDIAAGTAAWSLDLARLHSDSGIQSELHACDISLEKFPPKEVTEDFGIRVFQQDVTKPFPSTFDGYFDLVHMSFLVYALSQEGWSKALANINRVLKSGGHLHLIDTDPVLFAPTIDHGFSPPMPKEGAEYDLDGITGSMDTIHKMNKIFVGCALKNGFVVGLSYRLPTLLQAASFSVLYKRRALAPIGKQTRAMTGANGSPLAEFEQHTAENVGQIFDTLSRLAMAMKLLQGPEGFQLTTEDERLSFMGECTARVREGIVGITSEWVAQKM